MISRTDTDTDTAMTQIGTNTHAAMIDGSRADSIMPTPSAPLRARLPSLQGRTGIAAVKQNGTTSPRPLPLPLPSRAPLPASPPPTHIDKKQQQQQQQQQPRSPIPSCNSPSNTGSDDAAVTATQPSPSPSLTLTQSTPSADAEQLAILFNHGRNKVLKIARLYGSGALKEPACSLALRRLSDLMRTYWAFIQQCQQHPNMCEMNEEIRADAACTTLQQLADRLYAEARKGRK